jgi:hypothetical protein
MPPEKLLLSKNRINNTNYILFTMRIKLFIFIQLLFATGLQAQLLPTLNHPVKKWEAKWVSCPDIAQADYAVVMFRRSFSLPEKPERFVVHVSADNRYKLYVNGKSASIGPQLSDWRHWRYETIDIAPYLQQGNNVIAAEVTNWGPDRFFGIMSIRTAFMMQGETDEEAIVNTTADGQWKAMKNESYRPLPPNWIYKVDIAGGFYATNPGDSVNLLSAAHGPQDWTAVSFNDTEWTPARWIWNISNEEEGGFFWLMKPRTTPQVVQERQRFKKVIANEGVLVSPDFIKGTKPLALPPHSKTSFLLDFESLTIGFPELFLSGGRNSKIMIRYAENLFNPDLSRGDRNDFEGKHIIGLRDVIIPDGRSNFMYSPTWYRAFRFVQIDIETAGEALTLHDYYHLYTAAPQKRLAAFDCNDPVYKKIDEICRRTASVCTQDNLLSDAYYEQMMYVGDSWVHAMVNLYMTGDGVWLRNAIEQFDYSRMPDGNITSCYPLKSTFIIPNFSLIWVEMLYDFMMYCDDRDFIRKYVQRIRSTLAWFEDNLLANGLVGKPVGGYFVDWYSEAGFRGGVYSGSENGNSATVTLHYAATLLRAAELFEYIGLQDEGVVLRQKAEKVKADVITACWDEEKGLFAENPDRKFYDERTNIMAIKAQVFDKAKQKELLTRCLDNQSISKPTYYFRMNHFQEMRRLGEGSQIDKVLDVWKDLLPLNMTTTPECVVNNRSEAHPWGASPTMAFISLVAGIAPGEAGYRSVCIEPALGMLTFIKASYPHYLGDISVDLKKTAKNGIEGTVKLPEGLNGVFRFNNKTIHLTEGIQKISL